MTEAVCCFRKTCNHILIYTVIYFEHQSVCYSVLFAEFVGKLLSELGVSVVSILCSLFLENELEMNNRSIVVCTE
jgi:hypothetical protein